MSDHSPACPNCGQSDKTYKVSMLFLESTARLQQHQTANQPELDQLLSDFDLENSGQGTEDQLLGQFVRFFAPPLGEKHTTRRVHPDSMIIFFSFFALLLIYQIAVSQPAQLPVAAILITGGVLVYLLARKTIVRRYETSVRKEQEENERLDTAVTRWMHLYFCSRDKGVFDPEQNRFAPIEQISDILNIA